MSSYPAGAAAKLEMREYDEECASRCADHLFYEILGQIRENPTEFLEEHFAQSKECVDPWFELTGQLCAEVKTWAKLYQNRVANPADAKYAPAFNAWLEWEVDNSWEEWA